MSQTLSLCRPHPQGVKPASGPRLSPESFLLHRLGKGVEGSPWKGMGYRGGMGTANPLWIYPDKLGSFSSRDIPDSEKV